MKPLFVSTVAVVTSSPAKDRELFVDALGLPLTGDDDYVFTHELPGVKHFGVWPLVQAAQACFGTDTWPADRPVPQASIEFDVEDVTEAAEELAAQGYELLHPPRTEPWGQTGRSPSKPRRSHHRCQLYPLDARQSGFRCRERVSLAGPRAVATETSPGR